MAGRFGIPSGKEAFRMNKDYMSCVVAVFCITVCIVAPPVFAQVEVVTPPVAAPEGESSIANNQGTRDSAAKLREELAKAREENRRLAAELAQARKSVTGSSNITSARPALATESADVKQLRSELTAARKELNAAKASAADAAELRRQNRDLSSQLASAKKSTAPTADSTELKRLRADLSETRAELERTKSAGGALSQQNFGPARAGQPDVAKLDARISQLQSENRDLSAQVSAAKKSGSDNQSAELRKLRAELAETKTSDSAEIKRLKGSLVAVHAEADRAKAAAASRQNATPTADTRKFTDQIDTLHAENKELKAQLTSAQKSSAPKSNFQASSPKSEDRIRELQKQNADLSAQLAAAQKNEARTESVEMKKLKAELAETRNEADRAKKTAGEVASLQKQNKDLTDQLAVTRKEASSRPVAEPNEVKRLRTELSQARAEVDRVKKEAHAPVAKVEPPSAAEPAKTTAPGTEAGLLKRLREENSYLRNLLETYVSTTPELKGKLRKYQADAR
jgi:myosin heavy subunit